MNTYYIDTDLELFASFDLTALAAVLEAQELFPLHVTQQEDGCWMAGFEFATIEGDEKYADPESTIMGMLDIVEALEGEARTLWNSCSLRNFDIGYACGEEPFAFHHRISNSTLLRIANVGGAMEITLYGMRGQQGDEAGKP